MSRTLKKLIIDESMSLLVFQYILEVQDVHPLRVREKPKIKICSKKEMCTFEKDVPFEENMHA